MEKTEKEEERREECHQLEHKEEQWDGSPLSLYQGFWYVAKGMKAIIAFQEHFKAQDSDIILSSLPKSGTTWLKALTFVTMNRFMCPFSHSPLLNTSPHELVPFLELDIYLKNLNPNLEDTPAPRILSTHMPYNSLPGSMKDSKCRIVYICRSPLDHFISYWKFMIKLRPKTLSPLSLEEAFDKHCNGVNAYGPFWDQVLGYWKASQEMPNKVLFLRYEDMKEDIISQLKILAKFLGCPFSIEEERQGVIEEVSKMCSFENLKDLEVNKNGKHFTGHKNSSFFRKGEVGDWVNYLTPSMKERIDKIMEEKFESHGLFFKVS